MVCATWELLDFYTKRNVFIWLNMCRAENQFAPLYQGKLIKAIPPLELLKCPLPSGTANKYLFVAIEKFSCFPFAIPCKDTSKDIIQCLESVFSLCGAPNYLHQDRELGFLACDVKEYFLAKSCH